MKPTYENIILSLIVTKAEEERPLKHIEIPIPQTTRKLTWKDRLLDKLKLKPIQKQVTESRTYSRLANHWRFVYNGFSFVCLCQQNQDRTFFNLHIYNIGALVSSLSLDMQDKSQEIEVDFVEHFELLEDIAIDFGAEAMRRKNERMLCTYISNEKREISRKKEQNIVL